MFTQVEHFKPSPSRKCLSPALMEQIKTPARQTGKGFNVGKVYYRKAPFFWRIKAKYIYSHFTHFLYETFK